MLEKDKYFIPLILLVLSDFIVLVLSFLAAYGVRFYTSLYNLFPPPSPPYIPNFFIYLKLSFVIAAFGVFIFTHFGFYQRRIGLDRNVRPVSLVLAVVVTYIFIMALLFNYREYTYSRMTVGLSIPLTSVGMVLAHDILKRMQFLMIKRGIVFLKTVLVGPQWCCDEVNQKLQQHHGSQYQVLGYITTEKGKNHPFSTMPCLGYRTRMAKILRKEPVDNVIIATPPSDLENVLNLINICRREKIPYRVTPELFDLICRHVTIEDMKELPTVVFDETPLSFYNCGWLLKRMVDVVISSIALIITSPIMLILACLIKLDSSGSVFYIQERVGNDGRTFNMYKFRSMVDHAENGTGPRWATAKDPRTTKIGRFIRKYNLDELPQFVNVLRGDMSLVGPRPERPYFVNKFKEEIPFYMRRHMVKTGITGWAQVNGWRGDTSVFERTRHDLYYVENWSLLLDLKIIFKTLVSFKNAY